MYFEELKQALRLDEKYSINNLETAYQHENQRSDGDTAPNFPTTYSLMELWSNLEEQGLYGNEPLIRNNPFGLDNMLDLDQMLKEIDRKIKELEEEEKKTKTTLFERRSAKKQPQTVKEDHSAGLEKIQELAPKDSFSQAYKNRYVKTCLWFFIDLCEQNFPKQLNDDDWKLFLARQRLVKGVPFFIYPIAEIISKDEAAHKERDDLIGNCKQNMKQLFAREMEKSAFSDDDLEQMRFLGQIMLFIVMIKNGEERNADSCRQEAISYIAYYLANGCTVKKRATAANTVLLAKRGLSISDPADRQDAFNILGISAIEAGQKQLAYDTYFSWLNCRVVGELKNLVPNTLFMSGDEIRWREEHGRHSEALMKGNFAYVSAFISETYEPNSDRWKVFHAIAVQEIKGAIKLDEKSYNYHCTYGTLLSETTEDSENNLLKALEQYSLYKEGNLGAEDRLDSFRVYCIVLLDILSERFVNQQNESFSRWAADKDVQKYFSEFNAELRKYAQHPCKDDAKDVGLLKAQNARKNWEPYFKLQKIVEEYNTVPHIFDLELILLLIRNTAQLLQKRLRRWEYNLTDYYSRNGDDDEDNVRRRSDVRPIAYYTTLNTIKHIFDDLYQESPCQAPRKIIGDEKGKNCLTVTHAKYMNDPDEGLTLLKQFLACIANEGHENILFPEESPVLFRENIYNRRFVFLKSFTERIDNLVMWNRYASDYSADGKNSNGCCVQLDAEAFGQLVDTSINTEAPIRLENAPEDDYYLYRVVYISRDGKIRKSENPGLPYSVIEYYEALQALISTLNQMLYEMRKKLGRNGDKLVEQVREFLQQTLSIIMFLFKDSDYSDEVESRLIFVRTPNQQEEIRLLPTSPEKLCINPFFQVYISQIMFGPNVRDQELWTPYLQYQLNRMWRKHPSLADKPDALPNTCYRIINSEIHYHT